jgi:hypothetical protein
MTARMRVPVGYFDLTKVNKGSLVGHPDPMIPPLSGEISRKVPACKAKLLRA